MTTRTVTGTWLQPDRTTPASGRIRFIQVDRVTVAGSYMALPNPPIDATLDANGSISVSLPVTGVGEPDGWMWQAVEQIGDGSLRYFFELPAAASALDLSTVAPRTDASPGPFQIGPKGDKGDTGATGVVAATAPATYNEATRTIGVTLGTTSTSAAAGNDARLSDQRVPVDGSVTTQKLADDAVTADKLAPNSVTSDAIAPGVVVESDVADASISTAKVQDAAITTGKLSAGVNASLGLADGSAQKSANLSDLASASTSRTNLGLGSAATTASSDYATAAQGTKADGAAQKSANLSDLASASSARTNLGLGTAATTAVTAYATAAQGAKADTAVQPSRTVTAGTGLSGGGDLSADRTLALANTAVTAGNYGLAASVPTLTVDAQGRITAASNTSIAITAAQVSGTAITAADTGTVTSTMIADGTIVNADINASAAIAASKISGTAVVQARTLTAGSGLTGGGDLSADRTLSIATGGVTDAMLAGSISASKITGTAATQAAWNVSVNTCFYSHGASATTTASTPQDTMRLWPTWCPQTGTYSEVRVRCTSLAPANSLWRFGIYADNSGAPGALIADLGTVDPTGSTGDKVISSLSLSLTYGRFWIAHVLQGTASTGGGYWGGVNIPGFQPTANATPYNFQMKTGVSAGLPDPAGASVGDNIIAPPVLMFKRSA